MNARRLLGPALVLAFVTGCAVGPHYHRPQIPLPDRYAAQLQPTGSSAIDLAAWWQALRDPELDSLIDRGIAANPGRRDRAGSPAGRAHL